MTISLEAVTAGEMGVPILHENCTFGYIDDQGDLVGALGRAEYFDDCTVLTHTGSKVVANDLFSREIIDLKFGGEPFRVRHIAPAQDGAPRFMIPKGYRFFYPADDDDVAGDIGGVDAWSALHSERQLHLGECDNYRGVL